MNWKKYILLFKPAIPRRYLLFFAALAWTFAGGMLLFRSITSFDQIRHYFWLKIMLSIAGGLIFYVTLFSKISSKHVRRILHLKNDTPCLFSFFNIKGYIMMSIMISAGILLRRSGIISREYIAILYLVMGIPLLFSSLRFYYNWIFYYIQGT